MRQRIKDFCLATLGIVVAFAIVPLTTMGQFAALTANSTQTSGFSAGQILASNGNLLQNSPITMTATTAGALAGNHVKLLDGGFDILASTSISNVGAAGRVIYFNCYDTRPTGCFNFLGPSGSVFGELAGPAMYSYLLWGTGGLPPVLSGCSTSNEGGANTLPFFTAGVTGTCTVTLTPEDDTVALFGQICIGMDVTHPAILVQSAQSAPSCTITGPTTTGDIVYVLMFQT